jgi:hypothetical protein
MSFGSKLHARRLRVGPRILAVTILAALQRVGEGGFSRSSARSESHASAPHSLGNFDSSTDPSGNFTRFFRCRFSAS